MSDKESEKKTGFKVGNKVVIITSRPLETLDDNRPASDESIPAYEAVWLDQVCAIDWIHFQPDGGVMYILHVGGASRSLKGGAAQIICTSADFSAVKQSA